MQVLLALSLLTVLQGLAWPQNCMRKATVCSGGVLLPPWVLQPSPRLLVP